MPTLRDALPDLSGNSMLLVTVPVSETMAVNAEALRTLETQGSAGVYVSLSNDYLTVSSALNEAGVDTGKLRFVDAASRMFGIGPVNSKEVVYVDGPLSTDSILEGITQTMRDLKGSKKFVLIDSLTTLLLYNSLEATLAFRNALRELLKKEGAAGIIVIAYRDSVDRELVEKIGGGGVLVTAA